MSGACAAQARCSDVPSRVDPAAIDMGLLDPFDPLAALRHAPRLCQTAFQKSAGCLDEVVRPRGQKRSMEDCPGDTTVFPVKNPERISGLTGQWISTHPRGRKAITDWALGAQAWAMSQQKA